jgi:hypothetical protein
MVHKLAFLLIDRDAYFVMVCTEVKLIVELYTGQGSSEGSHGTLLQDIREQETRKGKAAVGSSELMREDLVQSAVSFLKHPKVLTSSDGQRRSFLENKGLTVNEIDEAFRRLQVRICLLTFY